MDYMIKFLADVNIEKDLVDFIKNSGYDTLWMPDYNRRLNDEELLKIANKEKRVLITNDKDFGELVFLQKKLSAGIILIRVRNQDVKQKLNVLKKLLNYYPEKIKNHFIVLTEKRIRIKMLE